MFIRKKEYDRKLELAFNSFDGITRSCNSVEQSIKDLETKANNNELSIKKIIQTFKLIEQESRANLELATEAKIKLQKLGV